MSYNRYVELLLNQGFRELGYFSGIRTFLGIDLLITVEEYSGGYQLTIDSVKQNIGEVYYLTSDYQVCQVLGEYFQYWEDISNEI